MKNSASVSCSLELAVACGHANVNHLCTIAPNKDQAPVGQKVAAVCGETNSHSIHRAGTCSNGGQQIGASIPTANEEPAALFKPLAKSLTRSL